MGRVKIISISIVAAIVVLLPDMVFELLHSIFEMAMEVGHTLFEILEVSLDTIVEHAFHTDLHQTQIIVFYIIVFIFLFWLRRLWLAWPGFYRRLKEKIASAKAAQKAKLVGYWQGLGGLQKFKIVAIGLMVLIGLFMFSF